MSTRLERSRVNEDKKTEMPLHGIKEELPLVVLFSSKFKTVQRTLSKRSFQVPLNSGKNTPTPAVASLGGQTLSKVAAQYVPTMWQTFLVAIVHKTENEDSEPIIFNNMGEEKES